MGVATVLEETAELEEVGTVDYMDRLRRLAIGDAEFADDRAGGGVDAELLDPKTLALVRLAALVAVGGAGPSYGAQADAAVSSGASPPRSSMCWSAWFRSSGYPTSWRPLRRSRWRSATTSTMPLRTSPSDGRLPAEQTDRRGPLAPRRLRDETPSFR